MRQPIAISRAPAETDDAVPPHNHAFCEVLLVVSGRAEHGSEQGVRALERGSVVVIPPGVPHWYTCTAAFEGINLIYVSEWLLVSLEDLWTEKGLVPLFFGAALYGAEAGIRLTEFSVTEEETRRCERELEDIESFLAASAPSRLLIRSAVLKVMAYLARAYCRRFPACGPPAFRREVWHVLHLVEAALSDGAPFRAGDAAKSLGLSLHHLGVLFRQATGHTMTTYYRNRRVQEAKRLLLDQQLSVAHVAHAVGFYDAAQLCRHFRVAVGESPAVYRRRYIGAQASVDIGEASPAVTFPR